MLSQFTVFHVADVLLAARERPSLRNVRARIPAGGSPGDVCICLLELHPDIRVLFTDIEMDGSMDGLKLAHAVRERWPPVSIMVTSGRRKVTKEDLPENGLFFAKPYLPDDIIKALNGIAAQVSH